MAGLSALDISGTMARRPPERDIAVGDAVAGGGVHGGLVPMSTLYEREHEFAAISATITSPSQGQPGMPFIAAGPGPGKTTLLAWVRAQEDGVEVRLASCTEVEMFGELGIFSSGCSSRESRKARLNHYADILSWRGSGLLFPCCWRSMTCTRRIWRCASGDLPCIAGCCSDLDCPSPTAAVAHLCDYLATARAGQPTLAPGNRNLGGTMTVSTSRRRTPIWRLR